MESHQAAPRFSMDELVEATDISDRTIRYYIEEGLLQNARGRGRSSYYTTEHLERLTRISALRDRGLSLAEIRESLVEDAPSPATPAQVWERQTLHPMLEVHLRQDASDDVRMLVHRFEQLAEQWFSTLETGNDLHQQ